MMRWLFAVVAAFAFSLPLPAHALMAWLASEEFKADPADCSATACNDATERALINQFPYWDYLASKWGRFMLGVDRNSECLWMVTCDHCGSTDPTAAFHSGSQWAGQTFDTMGADKNTRGGGAYRQFLNPEGEILGPSFNTHGDILYCLKPQEGETMPNVPFVELPLENKGVKPQTLFMQIGAGDIMADATLGWFAECATTVAGGNPSAPTRDACCTTERASGRFDAAADALRAEMPTASTWTTNPSAYGGEGNLVTCGPGGANLTYLGPVYSETTGENKWRWATWRHHDSDVTAGFCDGSVRCPVGGGPYVTVTGKLNADNDCERDYAIETTTKAADYRLTNPPTVQNNTRALHKYNSTDSTIFEHSSVVNHDSGGPTFMYDANRWRYVGSSDSARAGSFFSKRNKWDWNCWIHEECP